MSYYDPEKSDDIGGGWGPEFSAFDSLALMSKGVRTLPGRLAVIGLGLATAGWLGFEGTSYLSRKGSEHRQEVTAAQVVRQEMGRLAIDTDGLAASPSKAQHFSSLVQGKTVETVGTVSHGAETVGITIVTTSSADTHVTDPRRDTSLVQIMFSRDPKGDKTTETIQFTSSGDSWTASETAPGTPAIYAANAPGECNVPTGNLSRATNAIVADAATIFREASQLLHQ